MAGFMAMEVGENTKHWMGMEQGFDGLQSMGRN